MEEDGKVYYRFARNSILSKIEFDEFEKLLNRHSTLKKKFSMFKMRHTRVFKPFPLDYIISLPKHLKEPDSAKQDLSFRLENLLKNVAMKILVDVRVQKAKPSLKDMISDYMNKQEVKKQRGRIRIKEQVLQIYEQKSMKKFVENDPMFNKLIVHIQRVIKIMKAQTQAIDSLQRKIIDLTKKNIIQKDELKIVDQKEKIQIILKQREQDLKLNDSPPSSILSQNEENKEKELKFADIFPIDED